MPDRLLDNDMHDGLARLLHPRHIAVVGGREAAKVIAQCEKIGFNGPIWPVNPRLDTLAGRPCFADVRDLPEIPDATFIAIPARPTIETVALLAAMGAGGAVCYASGFAEMGAAGADLQQQLVQASGDLALLGPNCYGLLNFMDGAALWPDVHGGQPIDRGVAIVSQSGNMAINMTMQDRSLPLACLLSVGNQAKLGVAQLTRTLAGDQRIDAIGLHIEAINDLEVFVEAALVARETETPIVVLKTGRSDAGARATMSHTSSMAGSDAGLDALFRRYGIARVETLPEFLETLKFLSVYPGLPGRRFVSMSCSGGEAALVADLAEDLGLEPPPFTAQRHAALNTVLGDKVMVDNPLDYHTYIWGDREAMQACYTGALRADVDAGILVLDYPKSGVGDVSGWDLAIECISAAHRTTGLPTMVVASLPESLPPIARQRLLEAGLAPMQGIREALVALSAAAGIAEAWEGPKPEKALSGSVLTGPTSTLDEWRAKQLLAQHGLTVPRGELVASAGEAIRAAGQLAYPLVAKIVAERLVHKTEAGGVILGIENTDALGAAVTALQDLAGQYLVEEMVTDAVCELIVGITSDPQLGPLLMIGSGGVLAELVADRRLLLLPADREDIAGALRSLRACRLIDGFRGRPAGDFEAAVTAIHNLAKFAENHHPELLELDINPLLVRPVGAGAVAVDALVRMQNLGA